MAPLNWINQHPKRKLPKQRLLRFLRRACTALNFRRGAWEINFVCTTNKEIRKLNRRFFHKDSFTDCITFSDKGLIEIAISLDQAFRQARPRGLSLFEEVALLICHGLLHAKGFNDLTEQDLLKMRQLEFQYLAEIL